MNPADTEILRIVVNGAVWIVGLVIFGRIAMFIATQHFGSPTRTSTRSPSNKKRDEALREMSGRPRGKR